MKQIENKQYTMLELTDRRYKIENGVIEVVPVRNIVERFDYSWFSTLTRDPYFGSISKILDDELSKEEYKEFEGLVNMKPEHIQMRMVDAEGRFTEDNEKCWTLYRVLYPILQNKVMSMLVENGIVESEEKMLEIWGKYLGQYGGDLPAYITEEEREEIIVYVVFNLILLNNFQDIFGSEYMPYISVMANVEANLFLNVNTIIPSEIAQRVMYIISSPELYLISGSNAFEVSDDELHLKEIKEIIDYIEETYHSSVTTLENSKFRKESIEGFMLKILTDTGTSGPVKPNTIQRIFFLMRSGVGTRVIQEFSNSDENVTKTAIRKYIEDTLIQWWTYYKNDQLLSTAVFEKRLEEFRKDIRKYNGAIEIKSNQMVSPYKKRIVIANNAATAQDFNQEVNNLIRSTGFKLKNSYGGIKNANQKYIGQGLIKILDILVHP